MAVRVETLGYGNLRRGVEYVAEHNPDMELKAVLARRSPDSLSILAEGAKVYRAKDVLSMGDQIGVMIPCRGGTMDPPGQTPEVAAHFSVVDSFDTHANIFRYSEAVDRAAKESDHMGIMSAGWDPGMLSLNRPYASAILPGNDDCTFQGKGVNQNHSDTIRRTKDVKDARQYAIPVETTLMAVRSKKTPKLTTRDKYIRECFMVTERGADLRTIEEAIVTIPNHFADYGTTVHFVSREELMRDHAGVPHGGFVTRTGSTGWDDENGHMIGYSLKPNSSPEFTAPVVATHARAAYRLSEEGQSGYKTVLGIAPACLSTADGAELRKHLL